MTLLNLCLTFFYIGLFTIGGGIVTVTLIEQMIVNKGLISPELFYNMIAISESTPGPFGINIATYIGFTLYGVPGAILVTFFEVLPSIVIIIIIAHFLQKFNNNIFVKNSLTFLRPITTGLILVAVVKVFIHSLLNLPSSFSDFFTLNALKDLFNWISLFAYAVFLFLLIKFKLSPIIIIILGAIFGVFFC